MHRIELVVHRAGGAGQVIDLVHLHIERKSDVMPHQFEIGAFEKGLDVLLVASVEIVHAQYIGALGQQPLTKVRTKESGAAGNKNFIHRNSVLRLSCRPGVPKGFPSVKLRGPILLKLGQRSSFAPYAFKKMARSVLSWSERNRIG